MCVKVPCIRSIGLAALTAGSRARVTELDEYVSMMVYKCRRQLPAGRAIYTPQRYRQYHTPIFVCLCPETNHQQLHDSRLRSDFTMTHSALFTCSDDYSRSFPMVSSSDRPPHRVASAAQSIILKLSRHVSFSYLNIFIAVSALQVPRSANMESGCASTSLQSTQRASRISYEGFG